MTCPICGGELDAAGNCAHCTVPATSAAPAAPATPAVLSSPFGDPFSPAKTERPANRWKAPLFTILSLILFVFAVRLNYLRALHWAGVINAESFGYMLGGTLTGVLFGLLAIYLVKKVRGKKTAPASKTLGVAAVALITSLLAYTGEMISPRGGSQSDAYHQAGNLLKEAAGKQPVSKDANWWDAPSRDFFHDILEMNQEYSAEVAALDSSAIKDLYSSKSYGGEVHMRKVVSQLRTALAVDEKYASLDPIIKKMEDRVAAADVSESEKQSFLKGLKNSMEQSLAPRNNVVHTEEAWMKSTIDLYEFAIAHTADYSVRDNKLYFRNDATKEGFMSQQSKAIALHNDFLKAKSAMEDSRRNKMDQMGVSPSDLTPSQLGKPR
jgi:hypothetical protein